MRLKLNFITLEGLYLNSYAELTNGYTAYLEDSSWWQDVTEGLQKKDLVFTLDTLNEELYKATIYRRLIKDTWYMQSVISNKLVECKVVSTNYKGSLNDMVVHNENMFILNSK